MWILDRRIEGFGGCGGLILFNPQSKTQIPESLHPARPLLSSSSAPPDQWRWDWKTKPHVVRCVGAITAWRVVRRKEIVMLTTLGLAAIGAALLSQALSNLVWLAIVFF